MGVPAVARIRPACAADAPRLAELATQLGYPATPGQIAQRLALLDPDENVVLVAELEGGVAGWVHVQRAHSLVQDAQAEIGGLVVEAGVRGRGLGAQLMGAAEAWATARGCQGMALRSNVARRPAHAFYRKLGYRLVKRQYGFRKDLP